MKKFEKRNMIKMENWILKLFKSLLLSVSFTLPYTLNPTPFLYASFTDTGAGARAPGMGNAFTAIADDVYGIYYNPAGLSLLNKPELGTSYTQHLMGLSDNTNLGTSFIGYAYPLKKIYGTIGLSWQQFNLDSGLYQEQSMGISYGNLLLKDFGPGDLYAGINLKNLRRSFGKTPEADSAQDGFLWATGLPDPVLSGKSSVNALDLDAGLLYRLHKHYSAGLSIMHLTQPDMAFSSADSDPLPLNIKLGVNYRSLLSNVALQYETRKSPIQEQDHRVTVGAERWFPWLLVGNLGARASLTMGSRDFKQITAGISYQSRRFAIDYGFVMPLNSIVSIAGTHRLSFSIRFGKPKEPEESVELILEAMRKLKSGLAPKVEYQEEGLPDSQKNLLKAYLADARSLETAAKYQEALNVMSKALALNPGDEEIMKSFSRLNFIATMMKSLPDYQTDPVQSALHQGILAYLSYNDTVAIDKVSAALELAPESREIDSFLTQLELAVGLKRKKIVQAPQILTKTAPLEAQALLAIEEERYKDAISLSNQILSQDPDNISSWENLGISYFALGEIKNSLNSFEKAYALEKNPARRTILNSHLNSVRKVLQEQKAKIKPAAPAVKVPEVSATEIQNLYNQGLDLYNSGQLDKAKVIFERILKIDSSHEQASKALKRIKEEMQ